MEKAATKLEAQRLALQDELDGQLESAARNRMGQFATPTGLALSSSMDKSVEATRKT